MEGGRRVVLTPGPPQGISSYVPPKCILMEQGHCPKGSPELCSNVLGKSALFKSSTISRWCIAFLRLLHISQRIPKDVQCTTQPYTTVGLCLTEQLAFLQKSAMLQRKHYHIECIVDVDVLYCISM